MSKLDHGEVRAESGSKLGGVAIIWARGNAGMVQGFGRESVEHKPFSRFLHRISPLIHQAPGEPL